MLRVLFFFLMSNVALASDMMVSHSLGHKTTFKIAMGAEISKELHAQLRNEMQKMKLEPIPKGAVTPHGVMIDSVFVGSKNEVVVMTNKFILEKVKADQLYSIGRDFVYYSSRKENGFPVSIFLGNVSHDQAAQVVRKITLLKPSRATASEQIAETDESKFVSKETQELIKDVSAKTQELALREIEAFKHIENYQNAFAGCFSGYAQVWETYWAKPVRDTAQATIWGATHYDEVWDKYLAEPAQKAAQKTAHATRWSVANYDQVWGVIKEEAIASRDGGWQMLKDFFTSAYTEVAGFGNWSIEKKSQFFCNLQATGGALKLAKVYYPKPANNAALVMSEEVKKAALAEPGPLPPALGENEMIAMGVPKWLAARFAESPQMAQTWFRLQKAGLRQTFAIDDGYVGRMAKADRYTGYGTESMRIYSDGSMQVSYYAERAPFNNPKELLARVRNNLQEAIAETREATGNAAYQPSKYVDIEPSTLPRNFGHDGGVLFNLKGTADDAVFLKKLEELQYRDPGPAPVLVRPATSS